jgi:hypothetical protein
MGNNGPAGSSGNNQSKAAFLQQMKVGFSNPLKRAQNEAGYTKPQPNSLKPRSESLRKNDKIEGEI